MSWLRRVSQFSNMQQILENVSQGTISPQMAASMLQGMDVCGQMSSLIDSYGYLEVLSRLLHCPDIVEPGPTPELAEETENEENLL